MKDLSSSKKTTLLLIIFGAFICTYLLSVQSFIENLSDSLVLYIGYVLEIIVLAIIILYFKKNKIEVLKFEKIKTNVLVTTLITSIIMTVCIYLIANIDPSYKNMVSIYKELAPVLENRYLKTGQLNYKLNILN